MVINKKLPILIAFAKLSNLPYYNFITLLFCVLLSACVSKDNKIRLGTDAYPDLESLKANYVYGRDYSTEVYDRHSDITILAIHGGEIEEGTSKIARQLAGSDLNLYLFEGWLGKKSRKLHITSTNFNDPWAVALATSSMLVVSVHGQSAAGEVVCIGGTNETAMRSIATGLAEAGFKVEIPCSRLPGKSPKNITNKAKKGGVQLEITFGLLKKLEEDEKYLSKFVNTVRLTLLNILKEK